MCGAENYRVQGTGKRIAPDDRACIADAICTTCEQLVGMLRAEPETLFGLREDEAVARACGVHIRIY